jgi:hypothetical protein
MSVAHYSLLLVWRGRAAVLIGEVSTLVRYLRRKVARAFFCLKRFILNKGLTFWSKLWFIIAFDLLVKDVVYYCV